MAVSMDLYNKAPLAFTNGADWDADTFKMLLTTSSYTPSLSSHQYKSSITNEVTGTGYSAGGVTLTTRSSSESGGVTSLVSDDATFSTVTISATRYGVIYRDTGSAGTSALIALVDFGTNQAPSSQDFIVEFPSGVVATFTV